MEILGLVFSVIFIILAYIAGYLLGELNSCNNLFKENLKYKIELDECRTSLHFKKK